jgi:hypothetical protein
MTSQTEISFTCSDEDRLAASLIAQRAVALWLVLADRKIKKIDVSMDIIATHCNGNPLRLRDLLAADDFNFTHDVGGIMRHLDRETGALMDHFRPRYSAPVSAA